MFPAAATGLITSGVNLAKTSKTFRIATIIVILAIVARLFFWQRLKMIWKAIVNPGAEQTAGQEVNKDNLSYSVTQYKGWADQLQIAMENNGSGTDEKSIYYIFEKLKNKDDLLALIDAFGTRRYINFFLIPQGQYNLFKWIEEDLNVKEKKNLNMILTNKNIDIQF